MVMSAHATPPRKIANPMRYSAKDMDTLLSEELRPTTCGVCALCPKEVLSGAKPPGHVSHRDGALPTRGEFSGALSALFYAPMGAPPAPGRTSCDAHARYPRAHGWCGVPPLLIHVP